MVRLRIPHLLGLVLRLFLVAGCVPPLAGAPAAVAGLTPPAPVGQSPAAPVNEEEDGNERDEAAKKPEAVQWTDRRPDRHPPTLGRLPFASTARADHPSTRLARPTAADPFRNGLGSPYRC
ncbi:MAG: hypothetical protein K2X87_07100 [Gemmataceae bacterium]|nr:hypothetical protein [Gemmataceae bacterium]